MREQSIELTIYFSNILSWLPLGWMKDYDVWCYVGEKMHLTYYFPYHINFKFFHACLRNVKRFLLTSLFPCQQFQQNFTNAAKWKNIYIFCIVVWNQTSSLHQCQLMIQKKIKLWYMKSAVEKLWFQCLKV